MLDESNRVCLQPIRGIDGSDYINASFIDVSRISLCSIFLQRSFGYRYCLITFESDANSKNALKCSFENY